MSHVQIYLGSPIRYAAEQRLLAQLQAQLEADGEPAIVFANVDLPPQIDLIVFRPALTLVIEVKHWYGRIDGHRNGQWTQTLDDGSVRRFGNGYRQALEANQALRSAFERHIGFTPAFPSGAVVFLDGPAPGSSVLDCGDSRVAVLSSAALAGLLARRHASAWSLPDVERLAQALRLDRMVFDALRERVVAPGHGSARVASAPATPAVTTLAPRAPLPDIDPAPACGPSSAASSSHRSSRRAPHTRHIAGAALALILAGLVFSTWRRPVSPILHTPPAAPASSSKLMHGAVPETPLSATSRTAASPRRHTSHAAKEGKASPRAPRTAPGSFTENQAASEAPAALPSPAAIYPQTLDGRAPVCPPGVDRLGCPHVRVMPGA